MDWTTVLIGLGVGGGVAARRLLPFFEGHFWPDPDKVRIELSSTPALIIALTQEDVTVVPVAAHHRTKMGNHAIIRSVPHFRPTIARYAQPSKRLQKAWQVRFGHKFPQTPLPVFADPVRYEAANVINGGAGFSVFLSRLRSLPDRISLTDLSECAEAAYLETRPADFDFGQYYYQRSK